MPRVPVRIQSLGTYGTRPITTTGRVLPALSIASKPPAFALEATGDRQLDKVQQNARTSASVAASSPFADGNMVEGIQFTSGVLYNVAHGLRRPYRGFVLHYPRALGSGTAAVYAVVVASTAANKTAIDSAQITLMPQGTFTADVWVY